MKKRKRLGVALGSGGTRGLYHIGVLKALIEAKIPIDYLAGSSIGSWIGGHYALHKDIDLLEELTSGRRIEQLFSLFEPTLAGGFIKGDGVQKLLDEWLGHATFARLKIPFRAVATDLKTGDVVIFDSGNLALALRASMAIPATFVPVRYKTKLLVDGGMSDPVPDDIVRAMGADVVLSVDLMHNLAVVPTIGEKKDKPSIVDVLQRSIDILIKHLGEATTKDSDIILRPHLGDYASFMKFFFTGDPDENIIALGEREAKKIIPELRKKLVL